MAEVVHHVRHHGDTMTARWSGRASDAAGHRVRLLSERTDVGHEVLRDLAKVLDDYAFELVMARQDHEAGAAAFSTATAAMGTATASLRTAQGAGEPVPADVATAERAVTAAREDVAAGEHLMSGAVAAEAHANADATRRVNALSGHLGSMSAEMPGTSPSGPSPTAVDHMIRQDAGEQVPGVDTPDPYGLGPNATAKPLDPATRAWLNAQLDAFGTGAKESIVEPVVLLEGLTPGLSDDLGGHWKDFGSGLGDAATHPVETGKALIGWDDLSHGRYAHWAGAMATGAAFAVITDGVAAPLVGATRTARAAAETEKAARAAEEAEKVAAAAREVAERDAFAREYRQHREEMSEDPGPRAVSEAVDRAQARELGPRLSPIDGTLVHDKHNGLTPGEYDAEFGPYEDRHYPGTHGDPNTDGFVDGRSRVNTVPVGAVLDRLGDPGGRYLSVGGTPWEERALPVETLNRGYHRYEVMKPLPDWVTEGRAAEAFGQPGGSTQYYTSSDHRVEELIADGTLEEIP